MKETRPRNLQGSPHDHRRTLPELRHHLHRPPRAHRQAHQVYPLRSPFRYRRSACHRASPNPRGRSVSPRSIHWHSHPFASACTRRTADNPTISSPSRTDWRILRLRVRLVSTPFPSDADGRPCLRNHGCRRPCNCRVATLGVLRRGNSRADRMACCDAVFWIDVRNRVCHSAHVLIRGSSNPPWPSNRTKHPRVRPSLPPTCRSFV